MGVLEGFLSTWSSARATFGDGVPQVGADFDNSAHFRRLQADVESAAPESTWGGAGADTYADANRTQGRTLGAMAELDTRLGVEVDRSAAVVATGRRDLDAVRQWVVDAASTIPRTTAGERMLWPVVSKGADEIATIIQRSHGEMSAIAERMRGLRTEYEELDKPEEKGAEPLSIDGGDEKTGDDVPETALDIADIVQLAPFDPEDPSTYGPRGYMELVSGSGTWVPDPRSRYYKPTPVQAPLDLNDIVQLAPFDPEDPSTRGPDGYMELVPGLGAWVPDPDSPTFPKDPPQAPVDLNKIVDRGSGLGMPWETELIRDSGVWVPNPNYGTPR